MFYWNITWRVKVSSLNNKLTDDPLHFHQGRCTDAHCALRAAQRLQLWLWGWEAQDPRGAIWPLERQGVWAHTQDALSLIMGCDPMWSIMCLTSFFVVLFFLSFVITSGPVWKHHVGSRPRGDDQRGNVWHRHPAGDYPDVLDNLDRIQISK